MNVYFVIWHHGSVPEDFPDSPLGGGERAIFELAKRLTKHYDVEIHTWGEGEKNVDGVQIKRHKFTTSLGLRYIASDLYYRRIIKEIKRRCDQAIIHGLNCIEPAMFAPSSSIAVLHLENELEPYLPYPSIKKRVYLRRLKNYRRVMAVSNYIKRVFLSRFNYPEEDVVVLHNGADIEMFNPKRRDRKFLERLFGIREDAIVFVFSGRIIQRKGLHLALDAFRELANEYKSIYLLILGDAPQKFGIGPKTNRSLKELTSIAKGVLSRAKGHHRIIHVGALPVGKVPIFYASADVLLSPSIWEDPCPLVCAEAQASGIPVIGTNRGGIPEVVRHMETGLICEPSIASLKESMRVLIEDERLRKRLSANAQRWAEKELNWNIIAGRLAKIYEELLA